ncbi:hypothetical protein UCRPA7_5427 [Phaeoacremonium minimum UCRPA7]|uniref:Uncharacterized protein n=1 Tax=Phaeoacremonium minimum (strain UCR-PA7) TaxID=1286976 RepID=R8BIB4_PHAM7|nr:hypothetical protein UCRPA7_5427 [Phaeoacremonium minimum UCRPA7]EON99051.1 hypothetical protein UCRPA7_5427 [Phaeoacremonium minimum UCRPA7]
MTGHEQNTQQQPEDGKDKGLIDSIKQKFAPHNANPGPAIPESFTTGEEGTKEERRAKAEALNSAPKRAEEGGVNMHITQ